MRVAGQSGEDEGKPEAREQYGCHHLVDGKGEGRNLGVNRRGSPFGGSTTHGPYTLGVNLMETISKVVDRAELHMIDRGISLPPSIPRKSPVSSSAS
jgi:hypothetical protein